VIVIISLKFSIFTRLGPIAAHLVKHVLQLVLGQGTALDVADGAESLAIFSPSSFRTGLIFCLPSFSRTLGRPQIRLRADDQARYTRTVMVHLRKPLFPHVLEAGGRRDAEADEEDVVWDMRVGADGRNPPDRPCRRAEGVWLVADPRRQN